LTAVSCADASSCVAIGQRTAASARSGSVIEMHRRGTWRLVPRVISSARLTAVSCPSRTMCMAVGDYSRGKSAAVRWNGIRWRLARFSLEPEGVNLGSTTTSVSCPSARFCMAVGGYFVRRSAVPAAARWSPRSGWRAATVPSVGTGDQSLLAVSCTSRRFCLAVGGDRDEDVIERWNGQRWSVVADHAVSTRWSGVSCTSHSFCMLAGYNDAESATWNGTAVEVQPYAPAPDPGKLLDLSSVSCASAVDCTAVGAEFTVDGWAHSLVQRWDGHSWEVEPSAHTGTDDEWLAGVSCQSAGCTAVGYTVRLIDLPFVERAA
jgi:hypothetical protein